MIVATVFVYGHNNQINWSEWRFLQLPTPGDVICLTDYAGNNHYAKVRHTQYSPASVHRDDETSKAIVISDWTEQHPPSDAGS